jgi:hypothetical protein
MSIDYTVFARDIPENLESRWLSALGQAGFVCELRPGTNLLDEEHETGPYLKVTAFPGSEHRLRPNVPLLAGFGLSMVNLDSSARERLPESARECTRRFEFYTSAGRTTLAHALQLFGAAALAIVTNGILRDPQSGVDLPAEKALEHARRSTAGDNFEDGAIPFQEWPPESFDEELEYEFPEPIRTPRRESWLSRLLSFRIG